MPLICKDFLPEAMQETLYRLCPGLVLVPALSPETSVFESNTAFLVTHLQTVVAVVNTTDKGEEGSAILGRPIAFESVRVEKREMVQPPVLLVADLLRPRWLIEVR
ncbi:MAG: hypothetical protein HYZ28_08445 [Myxococcales bacterium]|nr:hypothetical protein [Myxococcales bacterium]